LVQLNEAFEPISQPQLLDTRHDHKEIPSQSEDARLILCDGKTFVVYNDNLDSTFPSVRRDMFIAEVLYKNQRFEISTPIKLIHDEIYPTVLWQKNWSPFEWNQTLLFSYCLNPHEVVSPNLKTGSCYRYEKGVKTIKWP